MSVWARCLLCILLLQSLSSTVLAHSRSTSYSVWELGGAQVQLRVRLAEIDLTRLELHPDFTPDYAQRFQALLQQDLQLFRDETPCAYTPHHDLRRQQGQVIVEASLTCPDQGSYRLQSRLLLAPLPSHLHFVQLVWPDGKRLERVLTRDNDTWQLDGSAEASIAAPSSFVGFWQLGVEHILSGWDHLAFVLALVLLAASFGQLAWLVTGFTLAHSLTLALSVLGFVQPVGAAVEALIALSILLVGMEAGWQQGGRPRWIPASIVIALLALAASSLSMLPTLALLGMALFVLCYFMTLQRVANAYRIRALIAFGFGLFHGFGFAGVLAEMDLLTGNLATALFGFNLGVESGQLLVVVLLWPLLHWAQLRHAGVESHLTAAVAGLGMYWFVLRSVA